MARKSYDHKLRSFQKYAEKNSTSDLVSMRGEIGEKPKTVKEAVFTMLAQEFKYFD